MVTEVFSLLSGQDLKAKFLLWGADGDAVGEGRAMGADGQQ